MKKFIQSFIRGKDELEASRLINKLQTFYRNTQAYSQEDLENIFVRCNTLYKRYSHTFFEAVSKQNLEDINANLLLFSHSTVLCSLTLSKMGMYEAERKVIDFFVNNVSDAIVVPGYIITAINNINSENALRLAALKKDEPGSEQEVRYYLDKVQDHLYRNVSQANPEKLGELALYQFIDGNPTRALEYLDMQYTKFSQDSEKLILSEITNNEALFKRSTAAVRYKELVRNYLQSKTDTLNPVRIKDSL